MRLGWKRASSAVERLGATWVCPLPRTYVEPPAARPRALVQAGLVTAWNASAVTVVDPADGSVVRSRRFAGWQPAGLDLDGRLLFVREGRWSVFDPAAVQLVELEETPRVAPERRARDTLDNPEEDPTLEVGPRRFRVRTETRSRVTRHYVEICDEGHPRREIEIAAYTLRSDRLTLHEAGGHLVYGAAGAEEECPAGALAGGEDGPVLMVRRRFAHWHEHGAGGGERDLVGHGPVPLELLVLPAGHEGPRLLAAGEADEEWEGLGRRNAAPRLAAALGARPVGMAGDVAVLELIELRGARRTDDGLAPRRRLLAGFSTAGLR
jgi:hypothetical protein